MSKESSLGLSMPTILKELADRLVADDWVRMAAPDGKRFYYIVGEAARSEELSSGERFTMTSAATAEVSTSGEYYTRAQIAAARDAEDYLANAIASAERAGLNAAALLAWADDPDKTLDLPIRGPLNLTALEAFGELLEASLIRRAARGDLVMHPQLRVDMENAREKLYLREIVERYGKILKRATLLDVLPFRDDQLSEAMRCFLYGFYRAAIVVAAAALEQQLKRATNTSDWKGFESLVNTAWRMGYLGSDTALRDAAVNVFSQRNSVVHENWAPAKDEAERLLDCCRMVIQQLVEKTRVR